MENREQEQIIKALIAQRSDMEFYVERLPDGRTAIIPGQRLDRSRQARWDARNRVTVSCSVPGAVAEAFREACQEEGYTPYAVLRRYIDVVVQEHRRVTGRRASARPVGPARSSARLPNGRGEWEDRGTAGTPRGRSPRAPLRRPSGLSKPEPRTRPYDWQKEGKDA